MPRLFPTGLAAGFLLLTACPLWADLPLLKLRHDGPVHGVTFTPDGKELVSVASRAVRVWDASTGAERRRFAVEAGSTVGFSPDGKVLAVAGTGPLVHLYDLASGRADGALNVWGGSASYVGFSAGGKVAVYATHLFFFDLASRQLQNQIGLGFGEAAPCALAGDGRMIAVVAGGTLLIQEVNFGMRPRGGVGYRGVTALAFAPDNQTLAVATDDRHLRLVRNGEELRRLVTPPSPAACLQFAPDGKSLAVGGTDGIVYLLGADGPERRRFVGHRTAITALAFSPDGRRLASASADGTVRLWDAAAPASGPHVSFSGADPAAYWADLTSPDPAAARNAYAATAAAPGAVPFLKGRIATASRLEITADVRRLLTELDDDRFEVRRRATAELKRLGPAVEPALRQALETTDSEEVRQRAERLLEGRRDPVLTADQRRALEAIELLVEIGTPAARQALEELGKQPLAVPFATEVRQATARLDLKGRPSAP